MSKQSVSAIEKKMYAAHGAAFESFCESSDKYEEEHGEAPNWDEPVIYFDGDNASWFDGGDESKDNETSGMLRFSMSVMENDNDAVVDGITDWLSAK